MHLTEELFLSFPYRPTTPPPASPLKLRRQMGHTKSMGFFFVNIWLDPSSPTLGGHWVLLANPSRLQCYHELARQVSHTCFQQSGSGHCHIAERLWWQSFCSVTSSLDVIAACEMPPSFRSHSRSRKRKMYLNHLENQWLWVARHRFTLILFFSSWESRLNCVPRLIFSTKFIHYEENFGIDPLSSLVLIASGISPSGQRDMDEGKKKELEARAR